MQNRQKGTFTKRPRIGKVNAGISAEKCYTTARGSKTSMSDDVKTRTYNSSYAAASIANMSSIANIASIAPKTTKPVKNNHCKTTFAKQHKPKMIGYILIDNGSIHKLHIQKHKTYKCIQYDAATKHSKVWCGIRVVDDIHKLPLTHNMFTIDPKTGKNRCVIAKVAVYGKIQPSCIKHAGNKIVTHYYVSKFQVLDILVFPQQLVQHNVSYLTYCHTTRQLQSYEIINKFNEHVQLNVIYDMHNRAIQIDAFNVDAGMRYVYAQYDYDDSGRLKSLIINDDTQIEDRSHQEYSFTYADNDNITIVTRTDILHAKPLYMTYVNDRLYDIERAGTFKIHIDWYDNGIVKCIHDSKAVDVEHLDTDIIRRNVVNHTTGKVLRQYVNSWCLVEYFNNTCKSKTRN